jgi:Uma2 family endonuclease
MAPQTTAKLTYEDYLGLPDDAKRYEILDGELCVSPAPFIRHQRIVREIVFQLGQYFHARGGGEVFQAPADVVLARDSIVQPDVFVVTAARSAIVREKNVQGAPDVVVEVISEGSRKTDEVVKWKLYERYGVDEYWVVDSEIDTIKIYRRTDGAFTRVAEITTATGGAITTPILPGFSLDVAAVFAQ